MTRCSASLVRAANCALGSSLAAVDTFSSSAYGGAFSELVSLSQQLLFRMFLLCNDTQLCPQVFELHRPRTHRSQPLLNLTVAHPCHDMNWVVRRVSLLAPKRSLRPCCLPVASMGLSMPPEQWHNRSLTPPTSARGHRTAPLMRLPQVFFPEFFQQFRKCHLYCQPSWR